METAGSEYVPSNCQACHSLINNYIFYQIWEYFLAYSTIISRQGSATCYQIALVKNINSTHRIEGVETQFGLSGALAASKVNQTADKMQGSVSGLGQSVKNVLGQGS